jgi:pyruvate dehydrogenase E2 component (dihydrolipoamide acetyltransferase)
MATPILMPQVGQDIEVGRVIEWLVREGDLVNEGDVIAVVESEKATFDVEAYESGTVLKILHFDGEEVEVLTPIGYIGQPGEDIEELTQTVGGTIVEQTGGKPPLQSSRSDDAKSRKLASPSARRIAHQRGIDLDTIPGSGPGGRVVKRDVIAALSSIASIEEEPITSFPEAPEAPDVAPDARLVRSEDVVFPFSTMRRVTAERLTRSKQTIPHFYLFADVDMTDALIWRTAYNDRNQARITVTDMVVQASASALSEFERMNAHVDGDRLIVRKSINIGVAVSVPDGLLVPVVPDADQKDIQEISRICRENAELAQRGSLRDLGLGTFTISNLGMHSINQFLPIINPPECAILGVGSIEKKVVAIGNGIHIRNVMTLSLACDHRAVDGVYAAQFVNRIKHHLDYRML